MDNLNNSEQTTNLSASPPTNSPTGQSMHLASPPTNPATGQPNPVANPPTDPIASQPKPTVTDSPTSPLAPSTNLQSNQTEIKSAVEDVFALPSESEISAGKEKIIPDKTSDKKDHQPIPETPPVQPTTTAFPEDEQVKVTVNSTELPSPSSIPLTDFQPPSPASTRIQSEPISSPPSPLSSPENIVPIKPQPILKHQPVPKDILPIPKKKRSCLRIFFLLFFLLLLLVGTPISLATFGISIPYLSTYIEPYTLKYLNLGATKDFTKVQNLSQTKVATSSGYSVLASIKIGSAQASATIRDLTDEPPTTPAVDSGEETTIESTSSSTTASQTAAIWEGLNIDITGGTNKKAQSIGQLNISPQETQTIFDLSYNFAVSEGALYLNPIGMTSTFDKTWLKIADLAENAVFSKFIELLDAGSALKMIVAGQWQKQEDTNIIDSEGKAVATIAASNNYKVTIQSDNSKFNISKASLNTDKDQRPIKLTVNGTLSINSDLVPIEINYYYYNFDSNPKIEIPAESEIQTVDLNKFLTSQGFYGTVNNSEEEKNARDKTRQTDLQKIVTAAESYKSQNGSYPVTTRIEKTNEEGALKQALVPDFIQSLPKDPLDPTYWYGYNSDGFSLQITAIVESSKIASQQGQSVKYQEIKK